MKTIVFACVHNAGRSQMAAAFLNQLANGKARAVSAGTDPGTRVHPEVVQAMKEVGVDLAAAAPQKLTTELASDADMLITMGCGDECPHVPGVMRDDCRSTIPRAVLITERGLTRGQTPGQTPTTSVNGGCRVDNHATGFPHELLVWPIESSGSRFQQACHPCGVRGGRSCQSSDVAPIDAEIGVRPGVRPRV